MVYTRFHLGCAINKFCPNLNVHKEIHCDCTSKFVFLVPLNIVLKLAELFNVSLF